VKELVRKLISSVITGLILGIIYYLVYVYVVPQLFSAYGYQVPVPSALKPFTSISLPLFLALALAERLLPSVPGATVRLVSKPIGSAYLYILTNGGTLTATLKGYQITINIQILLYIVIAGSIIFGVADAISATTEVKD